MGETTVSMRSTLLSLAIGLAGFGCGPQPPPVVPVVHTGSPPPAAESKPEAAAGAPVTAATCESGWLDSGGSLRLEFELEGVEPGAEGRAVQVQVARILRARLQEVGIPGARVSWMNFRQVVVDIPPGTNSDAVHLARPRLLAPGLPVKLTFTVESAIGPVVP